MRTIFLATMTPIGLITLVIIYAVIARLTERRRP